MCKASIIIPAYNAEAHIEQTIKSVVTQDFSDFEILVINDGSTDLTEQKVRATMQQDSRIRYISQANSGGPATPRNIGLEHARGDYIFIFDADDLMLEGKIRKSIQCLERHPSADLLFTNFSTIDEHGAVLKPDFLDEYDTLWNLIGGKETKEQFLSKESVHPALLRINFIGTSSVVLRKSALGKADRFDESLKNSDDRLFWMLFSMSHNFVFLNEILHQYRILPGSISNQGFIRRGPSKIKALGTVLSRLDDEELRLLVRKQIANDYTNLAYEFKRQGKYHDQCQNALMGLRYAITFRGIKLCIAASLAALLFGRRKI